MAKMTNTSTIKIMLDGSQAENEVQRLRKQLKGVGEELAIVQEKFKGEREWDSGDTAEKLSKRIKELKKTQRALKSALDAHITQITGVDSVLADRSSAAYNELTKKRTSLLNLLKRLRLDTEEEMRVYEETSKRLSKVQQEIGERDIDLKSPTTVARAQEVLARPEDYSTKEINEAIAAMTKFRDTKKADSEEWKHWNGYVRNGALFMEEFNQKVKTTNMEELHADLKNAKPTISDKDLNVLVKYWEEMAQGAKVGSTAQADFNKKLAEARDLQTARKREQGEKIATEVADQGQFGSSISEMQQRLKLLQDYRTVIDSTKPDAYVRVDAAIEKLTQKIKESQAGFLSYADAMKQAEGLANGTFKGSISDLDKIKKVLEEYKGTLSTSDTAGLDKVNTALGNIEQKQKELQAGYMSYAQAMDKAGKVMDGSFEGSIADLEKLQKVLAEYRSSLDVKDSDALKDVDTRLESIAQKMQQLRPGFMSFQDALEKAKQISSGAFEGTIEDLDKLQKVLKEGMSAELNISDEEDIKILKTTTALLDDIAKKQKELADINKREQSEATVERVRKNISGVSPAELEEAIRLAKELQKMNGTSGKQYMELATFIGNAESRLKQWNDAVKELTMERQLGDVANLSKIALEEQKKYWQAMVDGASEGDAALDRYRENLKKVTEEEKRRIQQSAQQTIAEYNTGNWDKTIGDTREAVKQLQEYRNTLRTVGDDNALQEVDKVIEGLTLKTKQAEAGFLSFDEAMKRVADLDHFDGTLEDLEKIQKVLKEGMSKELNLSDPADLDRLKTTTALLDDIAKKQKELADINKREQSESKIAGVSGNIAGSSPAELEETIRLAKELQKMNGTSATQYQSLAKFINDAEAQLKKYNDQVKHAAMENQFLRLANLSKNALEEQRKYWQDVFDNAEKGTAKYIQAERKLVDINKTLTDRKSDEAGAIMGNLQGSSVGDIERAIKMTEELMKAHSRGSAEYEIYAEEIKKAKEYLQSYVDMGKQVDMEDKWSRLRALSTDALAEQKKYWQEMVNGAQQGTQELADYEAKLKGVVEEERMRLDNKATKVLADPTSFSVKEVQDSIKAYEQLRDAQRTGSGNWEYYNKKIEEARETLKHYNDEAKKTTMEGRLGGIATASTASLAEQKKYWQEMVDGAERGTQALKDYQDNLAKVTAEERTRLQNAAQQTITDYNTGNWNKTIGETKEAIKQLQEYRNTLNEKTDSKALTDVDEVLTKLTQKTKEAELGFMSLEQALIKAYDLDNFDGSIQELEKLKKRLEEIRDTEINLSSPDAKGQLIKIGAALDDVNKKIDEVNRGSFNLENTLKNLDKASMKDLNRAAEELKKQIDGASIASSTFVERSKELRAVNKRLEEAKELWKEKENIITKTAKRLASYVLVYAGFNEIVGKLKEVAQANLELSDSLADIQKTTGLSAESVAHLSDQINEIDTRSAQKELHDLAYEAGKLGISAEEDVLAFVRAGNQLLVALGEDLGGAEAVRQLMKVNAVLGETQKLGVERALLATGSAINEISQTSRASAGPIADMVKRIGAIGAASNLTMSNLVALAGTADAMGQSAEVAGTAFNKFLGTLQTSSTDVAYSLGLDPDRLKQLLSDEETAIYGIIEIFEKMNLMGEMADLSPIMKDLGSEGARMTQVLTTMAGGVEELKAQVFTSKQAFEEATSVTNEYNIKNESAAAILERMGNNLREMFTNSTIVGAMKDFLQWLYYLPNALERNRGLLFAIRVILYQIAAVSLTKLIAMIGSGMTGALAKATKAWKMFNLEAANSILLGGDRHGMWQRNTIRALAFANGINKVKIAFAALGRVIAANPIFFIGTAVATVAAAMHTLTENTNKAAKAQAEFDASVRKEQFELDNLRIRIEMANSANGERASLIQQLNNKYGQYLGFMVTEANYLKNQEYIYKLLNAQIERSLALKMQEKLVTDISEKYSDKQLSAYEDMNKALNNVKGIGEGGAREAMSKLMSAIKEQAQTGVKDVNMVFASLGGDEYKRALEDLKKDFDNGAISAERYKNELYHLNVKEFGVNEFKNLSKAVKEMLDVEVNIAEEAAAATELSQSNIDNLNKKVLNIKKEEAEKVLKDIESTSDVKGLQEAQAKLSDYIRQRQQDVSGLIAKQQELNSLSYNEISELDELNKKKADGLALTQEEIDRYDLLQKKQAGTVKLTGEEGEKLKSVNAELDKYQQGLDVIKGKLAAAGDFSLWGEGKTIKDADVNQLVAMYKKLESDGAKLRAGATESIQTSYWKGFKDQKKAIEAYYKEAEKIKNELESRGYNTSGHFKWGGSGDKDVKRKAREEMQAAISAFEAYWNEYETYIKDKAQKENLTNQELNRQMLAMDIQREKERVELYKVLLGETNKFNKEMYVGMITDRNYFAGKDLEALAAQLDRWGVAMEDGLRNKLTKAMLAQEEFTLKQKKRIEKLLLEDNFTEQVAQQYLETIDELGLLFGEYDGNIEDVNKENARLRIAYMQKWAKDAYNINAEGLESLMRQNEMFSEWHIDRDKKDYEALLIQLRKFHDDQAEAEKKHAERMKRITDARFKSSGQQEESENRIQDSEAKLDMAQRMQEFGVGGEQVVNDYEIELIKQKIAAEEQWLSLLAQETIAKQDMLRQDIEAAERRMALEADETKRRKIQDQINQLKLELESEQNAFVIASNESINKMLELQANATDKYINNFTHYFSYLKEYQDGIDTFAQSMGEGIYGSKEDRQQAAKDLLVSVATTSKNLLQMWLTQLATRRLIDDMEVEQTRATEMRKQAIKLQSLVQDGTLAIGSLEAQAAITQAENLMDISRGIGKEVAKKGLIGLAIGAAISAALSALLGAAMGGVNKAKSEVAAATGANTGRLATGMLTYAEGNYPVLGNDGNVYNAKYEGSGMKTGIYRGGAHFGIFSEKKPEAIIDGDTTQRLIMNHPDIWKAIVTLSKNGRLDSGMGMRTFATGNINDLARQAQDMEASATTDNSAQMAEMQATMAATQQALAQLTQVLAGGIKANINMYGEDGMYKSMKKAEKYAGRVGYK